MRCRIVTQPILNIYFVTHRMDGMKKVNFAKLVTRVLSRHAMTEAALGKILGISQSAVSRLKSGIVHEPGWSVGQRLIELSDE